jgi:hypothetical protein
MDAVEGRRALRHVIRDRQENGHAEEGREAGSKGGSRSDGTHSACRAFGGKGERKGLSKAGSRSDGTHSACRAFGGKGERRVPLLGLTTHSNFRSDHVAFFPYRPPHCKRALEAPSRITFFESSAITIRRWPVGARRPSSRAQRRFDVSKAPIAMIDRRLCRPKHDGAKAAQLLAIAKRAVTRDESPRAAIVKSFEVSPPLQRGAFASEGVGHSGASNQTSARASIRGTKAPRTDARWLLPRPHFFVGGDGVSAFGPALGIDDRRRPGISI